MSDVKEWTQDIHEGDAEETLREMPASSVHMVMTSPPYFGLRDYGVDGQIGLEDSLEEYIQTLVDVGRAVRHVLRDDGSWWLNLGDSYAGSGGAGGQWNSDESGSVEYAGERGSSYNGPLNGSGFGRKNKMLVPHRVAIALQRDGWVVRNDVTWVKPNPMPSSVKDRLNTCTEQVFHLTPQPDYWYDLDAIREPYSEYTQQMQHRQESGVERGDDTPHGGIGDSSNTRADVMHPAGKNPGDVFEVTTKPFPDTHFAVYPPELVETPLKATCPPQVCVECGAPYERVTEKTGDWHTTSTGYQDHASKTKHGVGGAGPDGTPVIIEREFKGWTTTCECDTDATEPGIVLDPFAGAGTTCLVAKEQGRRFIGIDLNAEYVAMAQKRVGVTVDEPERLLDDGETSLTAFADGGQDDE